MNIIDAIKSGKEIKRSSYVMFDYPHNFNFKTDDILADDWELKQEPRKVTLYQYLYKAMDKYFVMTKEISYSWDDYKDDEGLTDCEILKTFTKEIEY